MKALSELGISPAPWKNEGHGVVSYNKIMDDGIFILTKFNTNENARLVAAAPELYDALRQLVDIIELTDWNNRDYWPYTEKAKAALAKASGDLCASAPLRETNQPQPQPPTST